jgi:hypothetical protein
MKIDLKNSQFAFLDPIACYLHFSYLLISFSSVLNFEYITI